MKGFTDAQLLYSLENMGETVDRLLHKAGLNGLSFRYIHNIIELRIGMFRYEGLPEGLDSQILETALFFGSHLCFADVPALGGWGMFKWTGTGSLDMYGKPEEVVLSTIGNRGPAKTVPYRDVILLRDNPLDIPPFMTVLEYVRRLVFLDDKIEQQVTIGTLPLVLVGNKKLAAQLKQTAKQIGMADPFFIGDDRVLDEVKGFDVKLVQQPLDIYELKHKYYSECMQAMGIYNVPEKHERMLVKELSDQNDYVDTIYTEARDSRKDAIEELNRRSGLNVRMEEVYVNNYRDGIEQEAEELETKAEALKSVDPEAQVSEGRLQ